MGPMSVVGHDKTYGIIIAFEGKREIVNFARAPNRHALRLEPHLLRSEARSPETCTLEP